MHITAGHCHAKCLHQIPSPLSRVGNPSASDKHDALTTATDPRYISEQQHHVRAAWQVPVIDLSQNDEVVLGVLKRACTSTGFFYGANAVMARPCLQRATFLDAQVHEHGTVCHPLRKQGPTSSCTCG